jgi:mono/diheme cytochrome c family protein
MRSRILFALVLCGSTGGLHAAETPAPAAWTTATVAVKPGQPKGYVEFQNHCAVCHGAGTEKPGTRALRAKYGATLPALLEERKDLSPQFVKLIVRQGVTVMPHFRKTELSDAELDAITVYLTKKSRSRK